MDCFRSFFIRKVFFSGKNGCFNWRGNILEFGMSIFRKWGMAFDAKCYSGEVLGNVPELRGVFERSRASYDEDEDFLERVTILIEDVGACKPSLDANPNDQFWRRMLIRNFFSLIEGQIYGMKSLSVHRQKLLDIEFSDADLAFLKEEKYHLNPNGTTSISDDLFAKLLSNYKFAFACYAKAYFGNFKLDDSGISPLRELEEVRNRLVHPKRLKDLNVEDFEVELFNKVWKWHEKETQRLFDACKLNEYLLPVRNYAAKVTGSWRMTQPYILLWPDGTVYGFPSEELALGFANKHSEKHPSNINFALHAAEQYQRGSLD